jgi:hypothetical protein
VVFTSNGGTDTILGQVRAQDVFNGQGINDQRAGVAAQTPAVGEMPVEGARLPVFGASDGLDVLFAGLGRPDMREMLPDHVAITRNSYHRVEANAYDEQYLMDVLLHTDVSSPSHDLGRTMVESIGHDIQPLELAKLVNLAVGPEERTHAVAFDTRHVIPPHHDILPF